MKPNTNEQELNLYRELLDILSHTAPADAPASESCVYENGQETFALLGNSDLAASMNTLPVYMLGILVDENLCQIFECDQQLIRGVFSYTVSDPKKLPPHSLVQIMNPFWKGTKLIAKAVEYYSPRSDYHRMGWFGAPLPGCRWCGPDPALLMKKPMPPWPQLTPGVAFQNRTGDTLPTPQPPLQPLRTLRSPQSRPWSRRIFWSESR